MSERYLSPGSARRTSIFSAPTRVAASLFMAALLAGCGGSSAPQLTAVSGFVGEVVADEPLAALAARDVLARGGNAADAAATLGLALSVTLPSRASLGAGGACLAWKPGQKNGEAFLFLPPAGTEAGAERPAAVPMLVRGLYLMQLHYGSVDFSETLMPARNMARDGVPVGTLLASDLSTVDAALLADEKAQAIFSNGKGEILKTNDLMVQSRLAGSLERIRTAGTGDLYTGSLGQVFSQAAHDAGGGVSMADMRRNLATVSAPLSLDINGLRVNLLPPPADGGLGMAAALTHHQNQGVLIGESVVSGWRNQTNGKPTNVNMAQSMVDSQRFPQGGNLSALPASTSFIVTDRQGETVGCALTMNNLFGTGRVAGSTGIVLAASPARLPLPMLAAAIAHKNKDYFHAAATASGQNVAADTAAIALRAAILGVKPKVGNGNGRANFVSCRDGLPGDEKKCFGWTDPRGSGLAVSGNQDNQKK
ncbi:gamma-glutamyltranspeptidase [Acetobacter sp. DsW_059]|nr:gamma-glutamyltransferase [Acetobacter sp. DsW_059]OUJ10578.1 gamma-glutamyltranspeptidase [Acetobacter sp. DsW_059]